MDKIYLVLSVLETYLHIFPDIVKDSVILLEQLRTIDKKRLKDKVCHLDNEIISQVNKALYISLEMGNSLAGRK